MLLWFYIICGYNIIIIISHIIIECGLECGVCLSVYRQHPHFLLEPTGTPTMPLKSH